MKEISTRSLPLALLFGAVLWIGTPLRAATEVHRSESVEGRSDSLVYPIDCDGAARRVRVRVIAQVHSGAIAWTLIDPRGRRRLRGGGTGGHIAGDTGELRPLPGQWLLEIGIREFTGNFRVEAAAK